MAFWIHTPKRQTHTHTDAMLQIRSIMLLDSTRVLGSTIPVELVLESDPVSCSLSIRHGAKFPLSVMTSIVKSWTPLSFLSHLIPAAEKQHLREVVEGSSGSDFSRRNPVTWLRCLRGLLCAELFPSWLEFNFLLCNVNLVAWLAWEKFSSLSFFWYDKRMAKSWPQLLPPGH